MVWMKTADLQFGPTKRMLTRLWIPFYPAKSYRQRKSSLALEREALCTWPWGSVPKQAVVATLLSFGRLFAAPYKGSELYIDIHDAPRDGKVHSFLDQVQFLPFTQETVRAGKSYSVNTIVSFSMHSSAARWTV